MVGRFPELTLTPNVDVANQPTTETVFTVFDKWIKWNIKWRGWPTPSVPLGKDMLVAASSTGQNAYALHEQHYVSHRTTSLNVTI
jgi:hypothetical protein